MHGAGVNLWIASPCGTVAQPEFRVSFGSSRMDWGGRGAERPLGQENTRYQYSDGVSGSVQLGHRVRWFWRCIPHRGRWKPRPACRVPAARFVIGRRVRPGPQTCCFCLSLSGSIKRYPSPFCRLDSAFYWAAWDWRCGSGGSRDFLSASYMRFRLTRRRPGWRPDWSSAIRQWK
jgi:hypothetical protein